MTTPLVVAKAPVAGRVKTRLAASVGHDRAADLAAAALLDTVDTVARAFAPPRVLALAGDLADAVRGEEIREAVAGWTVLPQRGTGFAERLAHAHADAHAATGDVVLQVGMDTPHATEAMLAAAEALLDRHEAVLGPAEDGGWWLLGLRDPRNAALLREVPMSRADTGERTRHALRALDLATTATTYDVDGAAEAERASRDAPGSRFGRAWTALVGAPR